MHKDELRAELTELANEVSPFSGDVAGVRRRVARRRAATTSVAVVVAAALAVGVVALTRPGPGNVHVAGSTKEVARISRADVAVVLPSHATTADTDRVRAILDNTDAVEQYVPVSAAALTSKWRGGLDSSPGAAALRARLCAFPATPSFGVELSRKVPDALRRLGRAIGAAASVQPLSGNDTDLEIFMQVKAPEVDATAVNAMIAADRDVAKNTFLDHEGAYAEFKKLFADQPNLVKNETPAGLPESFRLQLRDGATRDAVASRYENLPGVDQIIISPGLAAPPPSKSVPPSC